MVILVVIYIGILAIFYVYKLYKPFWKIPWAPVWTSVRLMMQKGSFFPTAFFKMLVELEQRFQSKGFHVFFNALSPKLFVYDSQHVEMILKDVVTFEKGTHYDFFKNLFGNSVLTSNGKQWKSRRTLLSPAFHTTVLRSYMSVLNAHAKDLVNKVQKSKPFELYNLMSRYSLGIICETTMGHKLTEHGSDAEYVNSVKETGRLVMERIFSPLDRSDFIYFKKRAGQEFQKHVQVMHTFCSKIIRKRKSEPLNIDLNNNDIRRGRMAVLDLLLSSQRKNKDITDQVLNNEVNTIVFAGHDTTSSIMTMILYLLGMHPEQERKLKDEIESIFGSDTERDINGEDLSKMVHLECIIKEALRMYPPVAFLPRIASREFSLDGHRFPKGTSLMVNLRASHMNPALFPEPHIFKPERFLGESGCTISPPGFFPFNAGPRLCLGQRFAMMEIKVTIAELMRHFRIKLLTKEVQTGTYFISKPSSDIWLQMIGI